MRQKCNVSKIYDASAASVYAGSDINDYLDGDYFNTLGTVEQKVIKQVKLPYATSQGTVYSGTNGLSTKVFLLSAWEVGWTTAYGTLYNDGVKLGYFIAGSDTTATDRRTAYLGTSKSQYHTRSPRPGNDSQLYDVRNDGGFVLIAASATSAGVRPALIIPSTARFDPTTLLLKG